MSKNLVFHTSTELVRIPAEAIVYIIADGNYSAIKMVDGHEYTLTLQLGQIERQIAEMVEANYNYFIRIGKSLIVNYEYISLINPSRQKMVLSDSRTFRHELSASREALRTLKDYVEKEAMR